MAERGALWLLSLLCLTSLCSETTAAKHVDKGKKNTRQHTPGVHLSRLGDISFFLFCNRNKLGSWFLHLEKHSSSSWSPRQGARRLIPALLRSLVPGREGNFTSGASCFQQERFFYPHQTSLCLQTAKAYPPPLSPVLLSAWKELQISFFLSVYLPKDMWRRCFTNTPLRGEEFADNPWQRSVQTEGGKKRNGCNFNVENQHIMQGVICLSTSALSSSQFWYWCTVSGLGLLLFLFP